MAWLYNNNTFTIYTIFIIFGPCLSAKDIIMVFE